MGGWQGLGRIGLAQRSDSRSCAMKERAMAFFLRASKEIQDPGVGRACREVAV